MNALAEALGFLVLYPEQSRSANFNRCWNWHRAASDERGNGEPAVIAALTRYVTSMCRGNPAKTYIAGLSAGGVAAAVIGTAYPDVYAALGVHSGLARGSISRLSEALAAMRGEAVWTSGQKIMSAPPTIIFHGDQDEVVHPSNIHGFFKQLELAASGPVTCRRSKGQSVGGRDYSRATYRVAGGPVMLEEWTIHGGGHTWSGGKPGASYTDPAGPDASREMIRFFLANRQNLVPKSKAP